ncbi:MAG: hypothetical protein KME21_04265 [Desmonostoc vinosum HA7617-LM4]|jgi:hypothetical protein|nr:hypothetical protein [Desmonostoc vinosum HA7617-LM4]
MTQWKQLRILVLALTLGGVLFVFAKIFLTKTIDKPKPEAPRVKINTSWLSKTSESIPVSDYLYIFPNSASINNEQVQTTGKSNV